MASGAPYHYDATQTEAVLCNICGVDDTDVVATEDRYRLPIRVVRCRRCGLQYQNPRLTAEAYAAFYTTAYRPLVRWYRGSPARPMAHDQWEYAAGLANTVEAYMPAQGSLLDVGGSTGIVGRLFRARFGLSVTVIDPALEELQQATDCAVIHASAETVEFPKADVALVCRSVDHFLDPRGVLSRLRASCGVLVVDAMDVSRWQKRHRYKVDHPFAFTGATLKRLVTAAGWDVVDMWQRRDGAYVGCIGR